jgi:hypothetical protein
MVLEILVSCGGCMQALLKCVDRVFEIHAAFLQLVTLALGLLTLIHLYLQTRCNELKILPLLFWRSDVLSDASQQTMKGDNVELLRLDLFDELFGAALLSRLVAAEAHASDGCCSGLLSVPLLSARCFLRMASDAANF